MSLASCASHVPRPYPAPPNFNVVGLKKGRQQKTTFISQRCALRVPSTLKFGWGGWRHTAWAVQNLLRHLFRKHRERFPGILGHIREFTKQMSEEHDHFLRAPHVAHVCGASHFPSREIPNGATSRAHHLFHDVRACMVV